METQHTLQPMTYAGWPACSNLIADHDDYPYAAKIGIAGSSGNAAIVVAYGDSNESADALAHLLAAAPDLLAACEAVLRTMTEDDEAAYAYGPSGEPCGTVGQILRAAIAKAVQP